MLRRQLSVLCIFICLIALIEPLSRFRSFAQAPELNGYWISSARPSEVVYVKTHIGLVGKARDATISLAVRDEFELWINGKEVASTSKPGRFVLATLDIASMLRRGDNVIGIKSTTHSRRQPAVVRAHIVYGDDRGTHTRASDHAWLAAAPPLFWDVDERADWSDDVGANSPWQAADVVLDIAEPSFLDVALPAYVNPFISTGHWFWPESVETKSVRVSKVIPFRLDVQLALGVAVDGYFTVKVNGVQAASGNGSETQVKIHDLTRYLELGDNMIDVSATSRAELPQLAIMGYLNRGGNVIDLSKPKQWLGQRPELVYSSLAAAKPRMTHRAQNAAMVDFMLFFQRWLQNVFFMGTCAGLLILLSIFLYHGLRETFVARLASLSVLVFTSWVLLLLLLAFNWFNCALLLSNFALISSVTFTLALLGDKTFMAEVAA